MWGIHLDPMSWCPTTMKTMHCAAMNNYRCVILGCLTCQCSWSGQGDYKQHNAFMRHCCLGVVVVGRFSSVLLVLLSSAVTSQDLQELRLARVYIQHSSTMPYDSTAQSPAAASTQALGVTTVLSQYSRLSSQRISQSWHLDDTPPPWLPYTIHMGDLSTLTDKTQSCIDS